MSGKLAEILAVGVAGSAGAVCRLVVGQGVQRLLHTTFPIGTLVVNVSGSFLLGWFLAYAHRRGMVSDAMRSAVAVGFIGAYTTFSTLMHDAAGQAGAGRLRAAAINLIGSIALGLLAVWASAAIARRA
jgi:CrcB protein